MAELIGLIASCIALAEVTTKTCLIARKHIHSDRAVSKELNALTEKISSYKSLIDLIKLQAEIDKDDAERLSALACVDGPLEASRAALRNLNPRLEQLPENKILGKFALGKIIDDKTAAQLKRSDNTLPIIQSALDSDQRVITSKVLEYTKNTSKDVSDVKDLLFQQRDERDAAAKATVRQETKSWLNTFDPTTIHHLSREKQTSGSGRWFLDHEFNTWLQTEPPERKKILWLRGTSGTGKTILLSSAIEHLRNGIGQGVKDAVAYFYCSSSESISQSAVNMVKSYIRQLLHRFPEAEDIVKPLYEDFVRLPALQREEPSLASLQDILQKIWAFPDRVVLFLDAINESDNFDTKCLLEATSWCASEIPNCQVMVSSTESLDLSKELEKAALVLVDMEEKSVDEYIANFITGRLHCEPSFRRFPEDLKGIIRNKIELGAKGSFRWAECMLHSLRTARSPRAVAVALETMAPSLDGHYIQSLQNIPVEDASYVRAAFLWLRFSWRPMKMDELEEAMTLNTSDKNTNDDQRLFPGEAEAIVRRCGCLISYDAQSQRVQLAHDSVREFLLSKAPPDTSVQDYFRDEDKDERHLCRLMVDYLNMQPFRSDLCRTQSELEAWKQRWPLYFYAATAFTRKFGPDEICIATQGQYCERSKRYVKGLYFQRWDDNGQDALFAQAFPAGSASTDADGNLLCEFPAVV